MDQLTDVFRAATAAIPPGYFRLQIDGGDPVYRERVYCYELYHQMRSIWPSDTPFYLNGEIDKAAHPILAQLGAAGIKPDLLVHRPGYMEGNYAIIEVKTCRMNKAGILKDLRTLNLFVGDVGYERAMLLVFGDEVNPELADQISAIASEFGNLPAIELWFHGAVEHPAELIKTLD